ncbi:MAG: hypothetical protein WC091_02105 [Sulfuricellaceae bacterium]
MKIKLTTLAALLLSCNTYANTTLDGIWSCQLQMKTNSNPPTYQNYFSIHSRADGQMLFAGLQESADYNYFGYGLGAFNGNTYTGSNKYAMPFSFVLSADNILSGTMDGIDSTRQQRSYNVKCTKVW